MGEPSPLACVEVMRAGEESPRPDVVAIIVAGGSGERFGDSRGKQFVDLCGLPLMSWAILAFDRAPSIAHIVVVCASDRADEVASDILSPLSPRRPVTIARAGDTRQDSVMSGLAAMPGGFDFVAVHDAARPLIEVDDIERACTTVRADASIAGAVCAARSIDTLKLVEGDTVVATPDRSLYWAAQTPQVFRTRAIVSAHRVAAKEGYRGTDDSSLVEHCGGRVRVIETSRDNIKVTIPEDLAVAEAALERRLIGGCHGGSR
jgi:2-C-methyl-D-erythritol 4-phosphate cytidylyltransferase